mmetsp:Transcript_117829/g.377919  ORF Transcript_117829/g.377919 Transcript_117829/m.377919 type:complete len:81 (+) Transcript_117829:2026-2268(+)
MFVQVTLAAVLFACALSLPLQHRNPEAGGAELLLAHVVMTAGKSDRALGMPPPKPLRRGGAELRLEGMLGVDHELGWPCS